MINAKAHDILFLKFKYYHTKEDHPNWHKLSIEAARLAIDIAKNIKLKTNFLQGTILTKRKILAILKTFKNLFINKYKMAKNNHNFIPIFWIYTMTNNCNFRCTYCSNHRGGVYPDLYDRGFNKDLTTRQSKELIRKMKASSVIYFCGGEPTLRKDLPELLDYSTKRNLFNMINTNGSILCDLLLKPRYRNFLMNMDVIIISLDSLSIPQLSHMYRVSESISRKVLRNILTLRILQNYVPFKLVANTVITPDTIEDTFDILNWCNDLNITFSPVSANINENPDWELLKDPRYIELTDKILERAEQGYPMIASKRMLEKLLRFKGFNCYPVVFDHIDYNGKLFWPCKAFKQAEMINILKYKNVKKAHKAAEKLINPTNFHGSNENQCQGNCAWMQNCVTDVYGNALANGFFDSGILKEIKSLLK
ncbi:MAG: radical SAM protein [Promethearchaeota archaeon]